MPEPNNSGRSCESMNPSLTVEGRIEVVNSLLDTCLSHIGFYRYKRDADWRRERSSTIQDRILILYGRKYAPEMVSCSPMASVYSPLLVDEIKKRYGAKFAANNFGARNIGLFTPSNTFLSWDCSVKNCPEVIATEVGDCFLKYCLPEIEKVKNLDDLTVFIEGRQFTDPHNQILSNVAPTCLLFLRGKNEECKCRLMKMLSLFDQISESGKWAAQYLPKREKIEKFIKNLP